MGFAIGGQESRDAMRASAVHIFVETEFIPPNVRLMKGDNGLLLCMEFVGGLRLIVDFDRRYFQVGQGEWRSMVRNGINRRLPPLFRRRVIIQNLGGI